MIESVVKVVGELNKQILSQVPEGKFDLDHIFAAYSQGDKWWVLMFGNYILESTDEFIQDFLIDEFEGEEDSDEQFEYALKTYLGDKFIDTVMVLSNVDFSK